MKLPKNTIHTETGGSLNEFKFSLDEADQGFVFEMLRKKIYEDPIGTVVREIASNARDANRENKKTTPISIIMRKNNELLNNGECKIEIRDNGPGISPERMEQIFVKYGKSTRRDSNDFTGGFGIGSKTPFSYSDVFNIKTIYNKQEYSYVAFIDESKRGKIVLQSCIKTTNETGTSIIVPINKKDSIEFQNKAIYYTCLWNIKPNYMGFDISTKSLKTDNLYEDSKILIIFNDAYQIPYNALTILIDGIPYNVKTDDEKINFNDDYYFRNKYKLFLKFTNGDLNISTNRENLHYDDITINKINKRYEYIKNKFLKFINEEVILKANSFLEACSNYSTLKVNTNKKLFFIHRWLTDNLPIVNLKYNDLKLKSKFAFKIEEFIKVTKDSDDTLKYEKFINPTTVPAHHLTNAKFFRVKGKLNKNRTLHIFNTLLNKNETLMFIKTPSKEKYDKQNRWNYNNDVTYPVNLKEDRKLLDSLNLIIEDYNAINVPKKKRASYVRKDYVEIRYRLLNTSVSDSSNTTSDVFKVYRSVGKISTQDKYIYLTTKSLASFIANEKFFSMYKIFNYYNKNNHQLIMVNEKHKKDFSKFINFLSIDDVIIRLDKKLNGLAKLTVMLELYDYSVNNNVINKLKFGKPYINKTFQNAKKKMSKMSKIRPDLFNLLYNIKIDDKKYLTKALLKTKESIIDIKNKYPLLKGLDMHWGSDDRTIKHANLYIQECDKNNI